MTYEYYEILQTKSKMYLKSLLNMHLKLSF